MYWWVELMPLVVRTVFVATPFVGKATTLFTASTTDVIWEGGKHGWNTGRLWSSNTVFTALLQFSALLLHWFIVLMLLVVRAVLVVAAFVGKASTFFTASTTYAYIDVIWEGWKCRWNARRVCSTCCNTLFNALPQFRWIKVLLFLLIIIYSIGMSDTLPFDPCFPVNSRVIIITALHCLPTKYCYTVCTV